MLPNFHVKVIMTQCIRYSNQKFSAIHSHSIHSHQSILINPLSSIHSHQSIIINPFSSIHPHQSIFINLTPSSRGLSPYSLPGNRGKCCQNFHVKVILSIQLLHHAVYLFILYRETGVNAAKFFRLPPLGGKCCHILITDVLL